MKNQTNLIAGAIFMTLAVLLGAFGAHALKKILSADMLAIYQTAVQYQFYHALGLLAVGIIGLHYPSKWVRLSGIFLTAGIVIFSGSLYVLALSEIKTIGAITPIGGTAFIIGWILLAVGIWKAKN
ncbi:MAG: DUF423 domain-containing protein [Prolixibacteraceae bacterium]|nr:DUF423 domain-containing protein [Prolixibacteraceae bacterium]